jgi:hypothetical protein
MGIFSGFERGADGSWQKKKPKLDQLLDQQREAMERERAAGDRFGGIFEKEMMGYDPAEDLERYTRGAVGSARKEMDERLTSLREDASAGGRLNTGFFDEDQGRVVRDVESQLENQLLQASMATGDRQFARINAIGNYATGRRENSYDFLAGFADREQARLNAKQARKDAKPGFTDYLMGGAKTAGTLMGGGFF